MFIETTAAQQDIFCRVRLAFYRLLHHILIWCALLLCAIILAWFILFLYNRRSSNKEVEEKKVYMMVDNIIGILKSQSETNDKEPYVAIQHIRDNLIPPAERQDMSSTWAKAVKFIEKHESRIRTETQNIEGEDYVVWRWLHNFPSGSKVWQGQACGDKDLAFNAITYSPTPCLKIRNMFDLKLEEGDRTEWIQRVKDAILEKTRDTGGSVLHIYVDQTSLEGCVYAKCLSHEDAGKVYKALHGWWFDRKLVTVKYVRLEHYHDKFPDSVACTTRMVPSTSNMASLAQPYYSSSLELT